MSYPQNVDPAPKRKRKKLPWIAGGVVGLVLVGCVGALSGGGGGGADSADVAEPAGTEEKAAAAPKKAGLGDAVRDGKFEFTVSKVKCGATKVGSSLIGEKAQGEFCLVDVKVTNIGKEAQLFADSEQKAFDAKKVEYSVDSAAAIYANGESQLLLEEINPGNTAKGKLVFDVPKGTKLTSLELHDSMFSGGVTVALK